MFNNVSAGQRVELANGMKGTVTEASSRTFFVKPDGGKHRTREYGMDGKTVDSRFDVKALLTETLCEGIPGGYDFGDGNGKVPAHYHINEAGDKGGIVADTAYVEGSRIGIGSVVFGSATVINSTLKGNARVGGDVLIENATLNGDSVLGRAAA